MRKLVDMFLVVFHHPVAVIMHLKKTADDNKLKYGLEAADSLNKNFYVDDMLKSVASVPEAITLVKNVCAGLVVLD